MICLDRSFRVSSFSGGSATDDTCVSMGDVRLAEAAMVKNDLAMEKQQTDAEPQHSPAIFYTSHEKTPSRGTQLVVLLGDLGVPMLR